MRTCAPLALAFLSAAASLPAIEQPAFAQQPDSQQKAQDLFDDALRIFDKGEYKAALEAFRGVQDKFPSVGALFKIGECYEKLNKAVAAYGYFVQAADTAKTKNDPQREKLARDKATSLEPKLPKLVVSGPVDGLEIRVNGTVIPQDRWNKPLLQGPGKKDIVARASGYQTSTTQVTVSDEGQPAEIAVPALEVEPDPGKPLKMVGLITAGVGVVGVGVGAVTGLMASGKKTEMEDCARNATTAPPAFCPQGEFQSRKDSANGLATVSTIGFIAGGILVAGGIVLYFVAPKRSTEPAPQPEPPKTAKPIQLRDVAIVPVTGPTDTGLLLTGRW
jgi:hypothetical protein